jgi:hypothetical protein
MEELLQRPHDVLDHGFVRVVDYIGNDDAIVQAARVSYGRGTRRSNEDRGLIRYLAPPHNPLRPQWVESGRLRLELKAEVGTQSCPRS